MDAPLGGHGGRWKIKLAAHGHPKVAITCEENPYSIHAPDVGWKGKKIVSEVSVRQQRSFVSFSPSQESPSLCFKHWPLQVFKVAPARLLVFSKRYHLGSPATIDVLHGIDLQVFISAVYLNFIRVRFERKTCPLQRKRKYFSVEIIHVRSLLRLVLIGSPSHLCILV